jgi:PilZ domain
MSTTDSPQPPERRDIRYPLHLPVSLKVADKKMHTRSENISLGGILLSSAFLIPEGSTVEVTFGAASLLYTSTQSSVRGKVLRVQPKATGDFAVAIAFEHPFRGGVLSLDSGSHR